MDDASDALSGRQRALVEAYERGWHGIYIYLILWLVVALTTGMHVVAPVFVAANFLLMLGVTVVRGTLYLRRHILVERHWRVACWLLPGATIASSLHWGLISAWAIHDPALQAIKMPMLLSACGIISAGTLVMSINPAIRLLFPAGCMLPIITALLLKPSPEHVYIAILSGVLMLYIIGASRSVYQDYWENREAHKLLRVRARELEELSLTDALTGLRNRLFFDVHFDVEWKRASRHRQPLAILLVDLDHFKRINDRYGHALGDLCLREAARVLRQSIQRSGDVLARYGGEEFIVMLCNIDEAGAEAVAERLLQALRSLHIHQGEIDLHITGSIGLAWGQPQDPDEGFTLIRRADEALYQAKAEGRNRHCVHRGQPLAPRGG